MNKGLAAIYSPLVFLGKISTFGVNRYLGLTGNGGFARKTSPLGTFIRHIARKVLFWVDRKQGITLRGGLFFVWRILFNLIQDEQNQ